MRSDHQRRFLPCPRGPWFLGVMVLAITGASVTLWSSLARSMRFGLDEEMIREIVGLAHQMPPEISADIVLRLVETERVRDDGAVQDLLEYAFQQAGKTSKPLPVQNPIRVGSLDVKHNWLAYSYSLGVDSLSLRCRVVDRMISIDLLRARTLFDKIAQPQLQALDCRDNLVPDVSRYYRTLGNLVTANLSTRILRNANGAARLLRGKIRRVSSPLEVGPAFDLLSEVRMDEDLCRTQLLGMAKVLEGLAGDDRSFSASMILHSPSSRLRTVLDRCRESGDVANAVVGSYRRYVIRHLTSSRCADTVESDIQKRRERESIDELNLLVSDVSPIGASALDPDSIAPTTLLGRAIGERMWLTAAGEDFVKAFRTLVRSRGLWFGSDGNLAREWEARFVSLLGGLSEWAASDASSITDVFQESAILSRALLELAPNDELRRRALGSYITFVAESPVGRRDGAVWLLHVERLLELVRPHEQKLNREMVLEALRSSDHPALSAYARIEALRQP